MSDLAAYLSAAVLVALAAWAFAIERHNARHPIRWAGLAFVLSEGLSLALLAPGTVALGHAGVDGLSVIALGDTVRTAALSFLMLLACLLNPRPARRRSPLGQAAMAVTLQIVMVLLFVAAQPTLNAAGDLVTAPDGRWPLAVRVTLFAAYAVWALVELFVALLPQARLAGTGSLRWGVRLILAAVCVGVVWSLWSYDDIVHVLRFGWLDGSEDTVSNSLGALCAALVTTGADRAGSESPVAEPPAAVSPAVGAPAVRTVPAPGAVDSAETEQPGSTALFLVCGAAQLLLFCCAALFVGVIATEGYEWVSTGSGVIGSYASAKLTGGTNSLALAYAWLSTGAGDLLAIYLRSVLFTAASFALLCIFPIVAKWLLVGRWKPRRIRVWSLGYLRFWVVKSLIRTNPLVLFVGTPIYPLYLRALGAKIGRGVAVFSRTVPVCTDLLTIGDRALIRKDTLFTCYRAHAGVIQTGRVTIGTDALVSEASVLDIDTSLGQSAQLGHASCLHPGQAVPAGERWHGTPGRRTEVDFRTVSPGRCGWTRRFVYSITQLLKVLVLAPLGLTAVALAMASDET